MGVLLPTSSWTDACDRVAAQLCSESGQLVVHDDDDDPVVDRTFLPEQVRMVAAGDPDR